MTATDKIKAQKLKFKSFYCQAGIFLLPYSSFSIFLNGILMSHHQTRLLWALIAGFSPFVQLWNCFANKATIVVTTTGEVIPVTICPDGKRGRVLSPHVAAWLSGFSIRFIRSPVLVDWNRVITPVEVVCGPHQAHPNLLPRWRFLPRECQDELVFSRTGDLYQVSSMPSTVLLGLVPRHGRASCQVAIAVETIHIPRATFP